MPAFSAYENNDEFYGGDAVAPIFLRRKMVVGTVAAVQAKKVSGSFYGKGNTGGKRAAEPPSTAQASSEEPGPRRNPCNPRLVQSKSSRPTRSGTGVYGWSSAPWLARRSEV